VQYLEDCISKQLEISNVGDKLVDLSDSGFVLLMSKAAEAPIGNPSRLRYPGLVRKTHNRIRLRFLTESPINLDGGLKCFGHPVNASGVRMTGELTNSAKIRW